MDEEATAAVTPTLKPGEKLLWSGRPSPGLYAWNNGTGLLVIAAMMAFGGFAGFGFVVVVICLAAAIGVALLLAHKGKSVRYGLTNHRAIIMSSWPWAALRSIPVAYFDICFIQGENDDEQPTTILFHKGFSEMWWGRPFEIDAFIGVKPSRAVAELIQRAVAART
jgi:hypothetical protein